MAPEMGKAELVLRAVPVRIESEARLLQVADNREEILPKEGAEHEPVVQRRAPAGKRRRLRIAPDHQDDGADEKLLGQAHACRGRHLKGTKLHQPQAPGRTVGRIELVDADFRAVGVAGDVGQKIAKQAVDQPRSRRFALTGMGDLRHRDFKLIERVMARFIDPRSLAGRTEEKAGKQVGKRGWRCQ